MKKVTVSREANRDIADIADYIAQDNPVRALTFTRELRGKIAVVGERPLSFQLRDEWGADLRSAAHHRYHIVFRVKADVVEILRVLHSARDIDELL
ncbi:MAG: type II toxin-antitoxin system RelE/ParE family toxin [Novosphingobium sp.]